MRTNQARRLPQLGQHLPHSPLVRPPAALLRQLPSSSMLSSVSRLLVYWQIHNQLTGSRISILKPPQLPPSRPAVSDHQAQRRHLTRLQDPVHLLWRCLWPMVRALPQPPLAHSKHQSLLALTGFLPLQVIMVFLIWILFCTSPEPAQSWHQVPHSS